MYTVGTVLPFLHIKMTEFSGSLLFKLKVVHGFFFFCYPSQVLDLRCIADVTKQERYPKHKGV